MNSQRLITSGCSCTQYCWPTWADYLGQHFKEYINVGVSGADNAVIARNVMEVASAGDIVVILWTGFDRFNSFYDEDKQETKIIGHRLIQQWSGLANSKSGGWRHHGAIRGSKPFLVNFYHRIERFRNTLDYVKMVEMHSIQNNYKVFNFSTFDWFLAESEKTVDQRLIDMHTHTNLQHFYSKANLMEVREKLLPIITSHKYNHSDTHPTPLVHWTWLSKHIAPELNIMLDNALEDQVKYDQERVLIGDVN